MNSWIENLLDVEDMRRRCAAHDQWMRAHPDGSAFSVYNDIPSEPTVIVAPVFDSEPDTEFGVDLGQNDWTAPGLITSVRKAGLTHTTVGSTSMPSPTSPACSSKFSLRGIADRVEPLSLMPLDAHVVVCCTPYRVINRLPTKPASG
jgi:hypothetical protein